MGKLKENKGPFSTVRYIPGSVPYTPEEEEKVRKMVKEALREPLSEWDEVCGRK